MSINEQLEILGISKGGYYYRPKGESKENQGIMKRIDRYNTEDPTTGVIRMTDYMRTEGYEVGYRRIRRLMRLMDIRAIYPRRNLSRLGVAQYVYPYLLRGLDITGPNIAWSIDITYIPMSKGFLYLTAIIDVYSRMIVGWGLHNNLDSANSREVLLKAIQKYGKPEIVNSDQGAQYTCKEWVDTLKANDIRISMDGRCRYLDNIYIERFWRTIKREYIYINPEDNGTALYKGINRFIEHYNKERPHQGIRHQTPAERYLNVA